MLDLPQDPGAPVASVTSPQGNAWSTFRRLISYALDYKGRLLLAILFAVVVAMSFTSMILGVAGVVRIVFGEEAAVYEQAQIYAEMVEEKYPALVPVIRALPIPAGPEDTLEAIQGKHGPAGTAFQAEVRSMVAAMRHHPLPALAIACGVVLSMVVLAGIARFFQEYFAGTIGARISVKLGEEMFENVLNCSLLFFERNTTGEILARFTNDIFQINRGLSNVFMKVLREPIKMVFFLAIAIAADPLLTLAGLCVLPPVAYVIVRLGKKFKRSVGRSLQRIASLASVGKEVFSGIAIVKGFCMEDYEMQRARHELGTLNTHLTKMVRTNALVGPLVEVVMITGVVGFVMFTGWRVQQGAMSADRLVMLVGSLAMILDPVRKLSVVNNMVMGSVASAERVFEFIDQKPDVVQMPNAVELPPLQEALRFHDVSFCYDGRTEVLSGIDLEIKKGEMVAIVGFSGAGKSTLVKLIPRFYDTTRGNITIDGRDIREASFRSLRAQISLVTQDTILFNETIRANIAFGREDFALERVQKAARAAHAAEFIQGLPQGYDTVIGESGGTLSGGQRQRLSIARAIIKDPSILILDEATSSLDTESERAIQQAIDEFVVGRTTVVIAHRLSTVLRADRIIVLDKGAVAEQGTHQELLAHNGIYKRLYETQFGTKKEPARP